MRDFAFYNAGVDDAKGPRRLLGLARRLLRRVQRPMLYRQEAIYRDLQDQVDALSAQVETLSRRLATTEALGWDFVALSRRLAAVEDTLAGGLADDEATPATMADRRIDPRGHLPAPHVGERSPVRATAVRP